MIDGVWIPVAAELGGQPLSGPPLSALARGRLQISQGRYSATFDGQLDEGSLRTDPTEESADLDIQGESGPNAGRTLLAIYRLNGDELETCLSLDGGPRPFSFQTQPGTQQLLVRYQRQQ